ncbi:MAG: hypothetical protein ACYTGW_09430 [Planctomycetota bacterium]|jgi:hypothetical protein
MFAPRFGTLLLFLAMILAGLPGVSACSSPQMSLAEVLELPREPLAPERFPGAAELIAGFDPQDPSAADSIPERALFGLELDYRGKARRWMLLVVADEPPGSRIIQQRVSAPGGALTYESRGRQVKVTLFDAGGGKLMESTVMAPWDFLCGGFVRSCELAKHLIGTQVTEVDYRGQRLTRAEASRQLYAGFATLTAFLRIVKKNKLLSSVLWKVVDRPSILSILLHGGVALSLNAELTAATPLPDSRPVRSENRAAAAAVGSAGLSEELSLLPGYRTTMQLLANGSPVLNAIMWVTEPQSPYRICGGIVVLEGFRPSDARVRFRMQLLAAERR